MEPTDESSFGERLNAVTTAREQLQRGGSRIGASAGTPLTLGQRHDELIRTVLRLVRHASTDHERARALVELMHALEDRLVDSADYSPQALSGYARLGELILDAIDQSGASLPLTNLERTYHRAVAALYAGRPAEATIGFQQACESEESDEANDIKFKSYVILGNLSHGREEYDAARELHSRSLEYAREHNVTAQALAFKALNSYALGDQPEAYDLFQRAIELFAPDQPFYNSYFHRNALLFSGSILYDRREWAEAELVYRRALEHVEPDSFDRHDSLAQLGRICYATGRWSEAVDFFRAALEIAALGPTEYQLDTRFWLARAEVKQGNLREARTLLREVIDSDLPYERRPQAEALLARCS